MYAAGRNPALPIGSDNGTDSDSHFRADRYNFFPNWSPDSIAILLANRLTDESTDVGPFCATHGKCDIGAHGSDWVCFDRWAFALRWHSYSVADDSAN